MRICISCTVDGCGAKFNGKEGAILNQFLAHMEDHKMKAQEVNKKAVKRRKVVLKLSQSEAV